MSEPVKVSVIVEDSNGEESRFVLASIPGRPFMDFDWTQEPVDDPVATAATGGLVRMLKPSPFMSIKLAAYGRVIE